MTPGSKGLHFVLEDRAGGREWEVECPLFGVHNIENVVAVMAALDALGVPVRVLLGDADELYGRARLVRNTVEIDPDAPTLAEIREILDAPVGLGESDEPVRLVE